MHRCGYQTRISIYLNNRNEDSSGARTTLTVYETNEGQAQMYTGTALSAVAVYFCHFFAGICQNYWVALIRIGML